MKDKRIGKTVFPYKADWGAWKHPGTKGLFNETQMDEMNAVDVDPPVVIEPFRLYLGKGCWYIPTEIPQLNEFSGDVTISAQLIDGEAVLVAEKVQP